jgi:hypothetical protein
LLKSWDVTPPYPLKHSILHTSFDREWQQQAGISVPWPDILGGGLSIPLCAR